LRYSTGLLRATAVDDKGSSAVTTAYELNAPPKDAKINATTVRTRRVRRLPHQKRRRDLAGGPGEGPGAGAAGGAGSSSVVIR
jgi:hypothetical protein